MIVAAVESQGIGLRPHPWAPFSRPVGPDWAGLNFGLLGLEINAPEVGTTRLGTKSSCSSSKSGYWDLKCGRSSGKSSGFVATASRHGKEAVQSRAAAGMIFRPAAAAVRCNDRLRDRQPEAEPVRFRGHERLEQALDQLRRDAGTAVADGNVHMAVRIGASREDELSIGRSCGAHRLA